MHAGHAVRRNRTRSAAGTFSGHRQPQSEDLPPEVWLPTLSDAEPSGWLAPSSTRRADRACSSRSRTLVATTTLDARPHPFDSCRRVACCWPHALRVLLPEAADRPRRRVARLCCGAAIAAAPRCAREPPCASRFSRLRATRRTAARCERAAAAMGGLRCLAARSTRGAGARRLVGAAPRWPRRWELPASTRPLRRLAASIASEGYAGGLSPVPPSAAEAWRTPPAGVGLDASRAAADAAAG